MLALTLTHSRRSHSSPHRRLPSEIENDLATKTYLAKVHEKVKSQHQIGKERDQRRKKLVTEHMIKHKHGTDKKRTKIFKQFSSTTPAISLKKSKEQIQGIRKQKTVFQKNYERLKEETMKKRKREALLALRKDRHKFQTTKVSISSTHTLSLSISRN